MALAGWVDLVPLTPVQGKTTVWIAKDSRKPLKISTVVPEMNGAMITAELVRQGELLIS